MGDYEAPETGPSGSVSYGSQFMKLLPELRRGGAVIYTGDKEFDQHLFQDEFRAAEAGEIDCDGEDEFKSELEKPMFGTKFSDPPPPIAEFKKRSGLIKLTSDGQILKQVLRQGSGKQGFAIGSKVFFFYAAFLEGQSKPFDTSSEHLGASSLIIGDHGTNIPCVRLALESMKLYELAQFHSTCEYAYGKLGCPPRVPPKANIFFNVLLRGFYTPDMLEEVEYMDLEKRRSLPFEQVLKAAERIKNDGNRFLDRKSYMDAVRKYRKALDLMVSHWKITDEEEPQRSELVEICYTNMAEAYVRLERGPQACKACQNALECGSVKKIEKTYIRYSSAQLILGDYNKALQHLNKAAQYLQHGRNDKIYKHYENKIRAAKTADQARQRSLYQSMLS